MILFFLAGKYVFIETSRPRVTGDKAWFQSQWFDATNSRCLQFWYHMFGRGIGTLNVYLQQQKQTTMTKLWTMSGDKGDQWNSGQIPIKSGAARYKVRERYTCQEGERKHI